MPEFDPRKLRRPKAEDPEGFLYLPEQDPVTIPTQGVMTRPWLDWARRLTMKVGQMAGAGGGGGTPPSLHHATHEPGGLDVLRLGAAARLFGRGSSGAGPMQEITLGAGLAMTGTVLAVGQAGLGAWLPVTNGRPASPELVFDDRGDVIVTWVDDVATWTFARGTV
jgi:hypothetical protein